MEKKHTPTPWLTSGIDSRIIVCKRGYSICDTGGSVMLDVDEDKANAGFIVEACNNYERLQSENEKMREFLEKRKKKLEYMQRANYFSVNDGYELAEIQTLLNPK